MIGLLSALVAPAQLAASGRGLVTAARGRSMYYVAFYAFWAALLIGVTATCIAALLVAVFGDQKK